MIRIFISKVVSSEFTVIEIKIPPLQPFLLSGRGVLMSIILCHFFHLLFV